MSQITVDTNVLLTVACLVVKNEDLTLPSALFKGSVMQHNLAILAQQLFGTKFAF